MAGYTRQSIASIINGEDITAPPLTAEFNQLADAFNGSTGHAHDGTSGNAPKIDLTTSITGYLPAVHGGTGGKNNFAATTNPLATNDAGDGYAPGSLWENTTTGRVFICVGNTSNAAVWRELVTIFTNNKIEPIAHDTVDLGTPSVRFQDLYLSGGIAASGNVAIGGTLNITGATSLSSLTASGTTTLNGDTDIGNANTDTVTITAKIDSDLIPSGIRDLGSTTDQWQNLYIDGTATVDTLTVDESATIAANLTVSGTTNIPTANITGGSIDGTPVGSTTTSSGAFTTLSSSGLATLNSVNIDGGAIDGTTIGASSHTTGKFTTLQSTGLATLNSVNIDGGAIDGTTIGATSTSSGAFTTLSASGGITGNLTGNVVGNVTGNVTGNLTGDVTGDLTGNVTASSGTSTFNNVTINGNLDMDATSTATITNLSTPVNSGDAASKGYVDTSITNLIDGAPDALNTLNELAAALADDANAYTTLDNKINTKLSKAGDTMTGNLSMGSNKVTSSATPSATSDLTNKSYVDTQRDTRLPLSGGTMSGGITMGGNKITATYTPSANSDLTTKTYVDGILGSATAASTSATAAATSATNAATSESNAATSAAAASASETAAGTSEANAASSASSASTSASNAATSESNASTSETNAASSASSASSSATAAANSATAAAASATAAAASESAASTSETNAAASAATAATEATKLTNSENLPDVRPSLLLDFANSKTLDPRITFTRGSTATYWDGKTTTKAEENLVNRSQELQYWTETNVSVTADDTTAPDGTTTADRMTADGTSGFHWIGQGSQSGYMFSVYAKAGDHDLIQILAGNSSTPFANFDLTNGTVTNWGTNSGSSSIQSVGNGWYRCTLHWTSLMYNMYVSIISTGSAARAETNTESGYVYLWGAQVEDRGSSVSTPTAYTATTSSPIVKYQPTLQTAASGEARFDHDPVTGESKGLLIEESRTNLEDYSEFSNGWGSNAISFYRPYAISPDGTRSAAMMEISSQETVQGAYPSTQYTTTLGTYYTASVFVRKETNSNLAVDFTFYFRGSIGGGNIYGSLAMNSETGFDSFSQSSATTATYKVEDLGDWWRISVTSNEIPTGSIRANIRMNSEAVGKRLVVWGFQVEVGAFPTSYIPTNGSTVTRSADNAQIQLTSDFYNEADTGIFYLSGVCDISDQKTVKAASVTNDSAATNLRLFDVGLDGSDGNIDIYGNHTSGGMYQVAPYTNGETFKVAFTMGYQDAAASSNGGTVKTYTTGTSLPPAANYLNLGRYATNYICGHLNKVSYYPQRLSNATLQAMTEA